ncbi:MAG: hypothetical protein U0903_19085 [Planctomycetales bacterium]
MTTLSPYSKTTGPQGSWSRSVGSSRAFWIRFSLFCAGIYNLLWGTAVIFFPLTPFEWLGLPVPNYPELWQCLGMVIGVYGIGYLIASRDHVRHWPIVLVGLLGKVFGPIGFLIAACRGSLPWLMGGMCVTNDLIWWLPFSMALWDAWRARER